MRKCLRTCSLPRAAELLAELGLAQDPQRAVGALLGRGDEEARLAVLHLKRDAAHVAADERAAPSRAPRRRSGRSPRAWTSGSPRRPATGTRSPRSRPTLLKLLRMWMSGSPSAWAIVELKNSQPSGSSVAIEPISASCTSGMLLLDEPVGVDHARSGPSRGRSATPGTSAAGRRRCRTGRTRRRRPRARGPCSSATAGRSRAGRCARRAVAPSMPAGHVLLACGRRRRRTPARAARAARSASGLGVERSMWQRQTQWPALSGTCRLTPAGWGSWTMITSQPPVISVAFISL